MKTKRIVQNWFKKWGKGDYLNLPITEDFRHTSPFGTIEGRQAYLDLVKKNEEKFLGHHFEIRDSLFKRNRACVRYTTRQGSDFSMDVSEWYYIKNGQIAEIFSYYHIGEIRADRLLD